MSRVALTEKSAHQAVAAGILALSAALLGVWALTGHAAQSSAQFSVTINLLTGSNASSDTGICRSATRIGTFGAAVTLICSTGAIASYTGNPASLPTTTAQDSSYRFVTHVSRAGEPLGTVDIYTAVGTVTSWRLINLANRDYLEMMVHW